MLFGDEAATLTKILEYACENRQKVSTKYDEAEGDAERTICWAMLERLDKWIDELAKEIAIKRIETGDF